MFDFTVNLGNLLTILTFVIGGVLFVANVKSDGKVTDSKLEVVDAQFEDIKMELKKLGDILVKLAEQSGRIDRVEDRQLAEGRRLDELSQRVNALFNRQNMPRD
jgi:hypothetical protein